MPITAVVICVTLQRSPLFDLEPENPDAARLMAKIAEDGRQGCGGLAPGCEIRWPDAARLEPVACALRFKEITAAEDALRRQAMPLVSPADLGKSPDRAGAPG
jgi:hypothetical protein